MNPNYIGFIVLAAIALIIFGIIAYAVISELRHERAKFEDWVRCMDQFPSSLEAFRRTGYRDGVEVYVSPEADNEDSYRGVRQRQGNVLHTSFKGRKRANGSRRPDAW